MANPAQVRLPVHDYGARVVSQPANGGGKMELTPAEHEIVGHVAERVVDDVNNWMKQN